jgi:hypothetical protein
VLTYSYLRSQFFFGLCDSIAASVLTCTLSLATIANSTMDGLKTKESNGSNPSGHTRIPSVQAPYSTSTDKDALRLAALGYEQSMERKFSVWSILGVGFSLTNSWFGLSSALVTGINSGGTALVVYGVILVACVSSCVAISLSELASAMPSAGGQYFWAHELAPKKYRNLASYFVGWFSWAGSIFVSY